MRDIGLRFVVDDSQKSKFAGIAQAANAAAKDVNNRFQLPVNIGQMEYSLNRLGITAAFVGGVIFRNLQTQTMGVLSAFRQLGNEFITVNERYSSLQINLQSALRSFAASRDIVRELSNITARSPLPFASLASITQSMAMQPQTSGRLSQQVNSGQIGDRNGYLQRGIQTVEAMSTLRPDQGAEGAIFAIREALGGQIRSLTRRFDIPSRMLQIVSGMTTKQLTDDPDKMMEALHKLFTGIVSPQAIAQNARQPSVLAQNLREQVLEKPLLQIGNPFSNSGELSPYTSTLVKMQQTFDKIVDYMGDNFEKTFAPRLQSALMRSFEKIGDAAQTSLKKLLAAVGMGGNANLIDSVVDTVTLGLTKVIDFLGNAAEKFAKGDAIPTIVAALEKGLKFFEFLVGFYDKIGDFINRFTGGGGSAIAVAATPLLLSNLGLLTKFFAELGTNVFPALGAAVKSILKGDITKGFSAPGLDGGAYGSGPGQIPFGAALLTGATGGKVGKGNTWEQGPKTLFGYDEPKFTSGLKKMYMDAFESNKNLLATLEEMKGRRASSDKNLEKWAREVWKKDVELLRQNPEAYNTFARQNGNASLAGISLAKHSEEQARANGNGPPPPGFGGKVLNAVGGVALGIGGALAVSLAVDGLLNFVTALNSASDALDERRGVKKKVADRFSHSVMTPGNKMLADYYGVDISPGNADKQLDDVAGLETIIGKLKLGNDGKFARPKFEGKEWLVRKLGGGTKMSQLYDQTGINEETFGKLIEAAQRENFIPEDQAKGLKAAFSKRDKSSFLGMERITRDEDSALAAFDSLLTIFDNLDNVSSKLRKVAEETEQDAGKLALEAITKASSKHTPMDRLMKDASQNKLNLTDPASVAAAIDTFSGVDAVNAKIKDASTLHGSAIVQEMETSIEAGVLAHLPFDKIALRLGQLERERLSAAERLKGLEQMLANASAVTNEMVESFADYAGKSKNPALAASATALRYGDYAAGADVTARLDFLKTSVHAALDDVSPTGVSLRTTRNSASLAYGEMLKNSGNRTPEKGAAELAALNSILNNGDPSGLLPRPSSALFSLGKKSGTDLDRAMTTSSDLRSLLSFGTELRKGDTTSESAKYTLALENAIRLGELKTSDAHVDSLRADNIGRSDHVLGRIYRDNRSKELSSSGLFSQDPETLYQRARNPESSGNGQSVQLARQKLKVELQIAELSKDSIANAEKLAAAEDQRLTVLQEIYDLEKDMQLGSAFDSLLSALRTSKEEMYNFAAVGRQVGQTIKSSLGDAFSNIVIGTNSISEAFRNMATSILNSIARILAQKAAESLLNYALGSFMGGGGGVAGEPYGPGVGAYNAYASGGLITGGSGVRDDRHILAMGGEYVLNKEAVQRIGLHNVEMINRGTTARYADGGPVGNQGWQHIPTGGSSSQVVHNSTITVNIDQGGNAKAEVNTSTDMAKELSQSIEMVIERKFQEKMRPGQQFNPINRR